jgi:hypothetical protein
MSLLALSSVAVLVGVVIVAFLIVRFAMKVMWKLAMMGLLLVLLLVGAGAAYAYFGGGLELPSFASGAAD